MTFESAVKVARKTARGSIAAADSSATFNEVRTALFLLLREYLFDHKRFLEWSNSYTTYTSLRVFWRRKYGTIGT